ncbi:hypothetical protein GCM10010233_50370 [Streptomyces pseudogriseolus]|uniref:Uncharacterized protein n=1 Tax=Streptomyces pseudogriseolus TaxID=36817 RepID=A0ABQ2T951_STREZ|nr:hypothetical protein GCM10010233_50370 [Streptomyces gancidicus]GGS53475.1 hypothetical protein GCM10010285_36190 [Streptomyces rubiginosus]
MPRRRSGQIRAGSPAGHRTTGTRPVIDGLSSRALSEIICLEHTRNYLQPGDVGAALGLWRDYVHQPERVLWHDYERGSNAHWYCCGDPFEARALLDTVMQALSPPSARQLRRIVSRSDAVWNLPSPPHEADGR